MSLVLQPQGSFTVVRQIANHTDTNTYYVQAVIRKAYTDEIIDTIQLTDRGAQRFSKNWQVPADPSGQGFYISIVTSVYTDSGYTTKSENYGDEENTYLVQERVLHLAGGGGLDAFTVRQIVREELGKLPPQEPFPPIPPGRWDEVLTGIAELRDDKNVLAAIAKVQKVVDSLPKEIPPTNLESVTERQDELIDAIRPLTEKMGEVISKNDTEARATNALIIRILAGLVRDDKAGATKDVPFDVKNLAV